MARSVAYGLAALMLATSVSGTPAFAKPHKRDNPPAPYSYWDKRRDPPPGHEFRPPPGPAVRWEDHNRPPPNWGQPEWRQRQDWLRRHGHEHDDDSSVVGVIAGALLGYALGAAVVDSQTQQQNANARLNDPAWIAYCARRYQSFDPYTGTFLGSDGLRHYCR
jgi:hypothetical protein